MPVRVLFYLGDILVLSSSGLQTTVDLRTTIETLQYLGFSINVEKSHFTPSNHLLHLGTLIDTLSCRVFLSQERQASLKDLVGRVSRERTNPLALLSQLLGKMVPCISIIPWARLHLRDLQWFLLPFQKANRSNSSAKVRIPSEVAGVAGCQLGSPVVPSLGVQKTHPGSDRQCGYQSPHQSSGDTRSRALMQEVEGLCLWVEKHLISIIAEHISGVTNVQVDWLSRATVDHSEWHLHLTLFREITD